ncbi:hypothetical protein BDZ91DRAFT_724319 [Kalaharituber pfeilii]|nr:hypothetical protein BDZ91DRAFT_724319 [Kalaharituber pfeilii]
MPQPPAYWLRLLRSAPLCHSQLTPCPQLARRPSHSAAQNCLIHVLILHFPVHRAELARTARAFYSSWIFLCSL